MESIEGSFIIEVDNQPIGIVEDNGEPHLHASLGPNPAIFTLVDGHLESGGWALGRSLVEDRSLLPKRVFWFNKQHTGLESIHKTVAIITEDSYGLEFAGKITQTF